MDRNQKIAADVLAAVGGKENGAGGQLYDKAAV